MLMTNELMSMEHSWNILTGENWTIWRKVCSRAIFCTTHPSRTGLGL